MQIGPVPELASLSNKYPGTVIRILSGYPTENGARSLFEIQTDAPEQLIEDLETILPIHSMDLIHTDTDVVVALIEGEPPTAYNVSRDIELHPAYPVVIRDGFLYSEIVVPQSVVKEVRDSLDEHDVDYQILSVTEDYERGEILTERQREVVLVAIQNGYYEEPRRCTLADIGSILGTNKSAVSSILRRAENTIITEMAAEFGVLPGS